MRLLDALTRLPKARRGDFMRAWRDLGCDDKFATFLSKPMNVALKLMTGELVALECTEADCVLSLKQKLCSARGIPCELQRLFAAVRVSSDAKGAEASAETSGGSSNETVDVILDDDTRTLSSYGLRADCVVCVAVTGVTVRHR